MARILRRRIARHTPSAMSRRDTASEINQWLKLGLTAAQIGERLIPDDPTMTKEQMHAIIRARMAGADAPPSAARRVVDAAIEDYISPGQPAAGVASSQASPTPRLTPSAAPVPPATLGLAERIGPLDYAPTRVQVEERADQIARSALYDAARDLDDGSAEALARFGEGVIPCPGQAEAQAEMELADVLGTSPPEVAAVEPGSPQAQAVANDTIKELAVEAPKAATSADEVIAMYDKLVEASGPRGFFERLGFGMGARMDAVNKAFLTNLNKSPLAREGSGAELRAATALVLQKAKKAEAARRRAALREARSLEWENKQAAKKLDWENKNDFQDKKTKDQLRVAQAKGYQTRLNKRTRATPATSQEQMLGKGTALDANKKIAAEEAKKIENERELETALKDPRIAKLVKLNDKGGLTELKELADNEVKRLLPIYRLIGKIQGNDEVIKIQTAREKAAREQMANRADIDAIDRELGLDD